MTQADHALPRTRPSHAESRKRPFLRRVAGLMSRCCYSSQVIDI